MKRSILIVCAAFLIAGCKPEGGTSDTYNTDTSTRSSSSSSSTTNINAAPSSVTTNDTTITPGSATNAPRANP